MRNATAEQTPLPPAAAGFRPQPRANAYAPVTESPHALDRAGERRKDAAWLHTALTSPGALLCATWRSRNLLHFAAPLPDGGERPLVGEGINAQLSDAAPALLPAQRAQALVAAAAAVSFLGCRLTDGMPVFAAHLPDLLPAGAEPLADPALRAALTSAGDGGPEQYGFHDLRRVGVVMEHGAAALLAYARALGEWHGRTRFCSRCGSPAEPAEGGHVRRCVDHTCAAEHFPRTDSAVIMLVTRGGSSGDPADDLCLLARNRRFQLPLYSTLAGFLEPGETLEDCVVREAMEEAGVAVTAIRYAHCQPWPFPASLMVGFYARTESAALRIDGHELVDARWVRRADLLLTDDARGFLLPPPDSIARRLILDWATGIAGD